MTVTNSTAQADTVSMKQPGGGVPQQQKPLEKPPPTLRENQLQGTAAGYKAQVKADGIPFRWGLSYTCLASSMY